MEFVLLFAQSIKIGSVEDVSVNLDTILSITSVLNALLVNSMTSTKEYAEFNAEPIKSTTSTQENVIVLKDSILFLELALNVKLEKHMTHTLKPAPSLPAKESTNSIAPSTDNVSANPNMSELKESAPTALLDITMIHTLINASASLDTNKLEDSVNHFAHLIKYTSMENVNATMDFLSLTENVFHLDSALLTVTLIRTVDVVFAMMDIQLSMENAAHTNTAVLMDILNSVNVIVKLDSSGFSEAVNHVEVMKPTMESFVNA